MTRNKLCRRLLLPLTITGALAALPAAPSHAGTFVHHSCGTPGGTAQGWGGNRSHSNVFTDSQCSGAGGRIGVRLSHGGGPWAPGAGGSVVYTAPADLSISRWQFRELGDFFGQNPASPYSEQLVYYLGTPARTIEHRGFLGGNSFAGRRSWDLETGSVLLSVFCWGETPAPGCGQPHPHLDAPQFHLYENYFTLRDDHDPTAGAVSGALAEAGAHDGLQTLQAAVSDRGAGIYRTIVTVDGTERSRTVIDANGGDCVDADAADPRYQFTDHTPCPLAKQVSVALDTTTLTDGEHDLRVAVEDASGNQVTLLRNESFVVDNVPPPVNSMRPSIAGSPQAGFTLIAEPGTWIGSGISYSYQWLRCDEDGGSCEDIAVGDAQSYVATARDTGRRLRVRVTARNSDGATDALSLPTPLVASASSHGFELPDRDTGAGGGAGSPSGRFDRGAANGANASDRAKLSAFTRNRQTRIRSRFGRTVQVSGRLVDEHGQPIGGAQIEVLSTLRKAAAKSSRLGSVRTGADGTYSYRLRATASRTIRFAYRSHLGDNHFADTSDVDLLVTGAGRIKVSKRRVVNKQRVTFSGRLRGEPPARGIVVVFQAKVGRKWQTFAHTRTRRGGRFKRSYRFLRTYTTQTYRFRARLLRDVTWAYEPGLTNQVKVKVRGR